MQPFKPWRSKNKCIRKTKLSVCLSQSSAAKPAEQSGICCISGMCCIIVARQQLWY